MIHILLLILKITGFILLLILGLLLLILSIILLVPLRYDLDGSYHEKPDISFRLSWLLRAFCIKGYYKDEIQYATYLFGREFRSKEKQEEQEYIQEDTLVEEIKEEHAATEQSSIPEVKEEQPAAKVQKKQNKKQSKKQNKKKQNKKKQNKKRVKEKNILEEIKEFVSDEKNRETLLLILKQLKKILKHILPVKISGKIHFGFDDPYKTGQVLAILSLFYVKYADDLKVIPDFCSQIIEGDCKIKGRIRIITLLICVVRVLLNKNFRVLWRKYMKEDS